MQTHFEFQLPDWVLPFVAERGELYPTVEERVGLAIDLSRENIQRKTGGPFGAAVFDDTGRLVTPGVNLVPSRNCSILHAEMVAIALSQQALGRYDLGDGGKQSFELAASTEPCAMCFGAVPWSGVRRLSCGARDEDARAVGFDEGAKLKAWPEALAERGITVERDILREEAREVFKLYQQLNGTIY